MNVEKLHSKGQNLKLFNEKSPKLEFGKTHGTAYSLRFVVKEKIDLKGFTIYATGGAQIDAFRVSIYEVMGYAQAPLYNQVPIYSSNIEKTTNGYEKIDVKLKESVIVKKSVFFVVIDNIKDNLFILADLYKSEPVCKSKEGKDYYSCQIYKSNTWNNLPNNLNFEVKYESCIRNRSLLERDTTILNKEISYVGNLKFMSVDDLNCDGFKDILINNKIFENVNGKEFKLRSIKNISEKAQLSLILDIDNNGIYDIVQIGVTPKNGTIYINEGKWKFTEYKFEHPILTNPQNFAIGYLDGDKYPEIFIGQKTISQDTHQVGSFILFGNKGTGFVAQEFSGYNFLSNDIVASAIGDFDNDNKSDLQVFVLNEDKSSSGYLVKFNEHEVVETLFLTNSFNMNGCEWDYVDDDEFLDVLTPQSLIPSFKEVLTESVYKLSGNQNEVSRSNTFYSAYTGGSWVDINQDGLKDYVLTNECSCKEYQVFLQEKKNNFSDYADNHNVPRITGIKDLAIADVDNNSTPDLVFVSNDTLMILKNNVASDAKSLRVDKAIIPYGSRLMIYTDKGVVRSQKMAGKGQLIMNGYDVLSIPKNAEIDSIIYVEPNESYYYITKEYPKNGLLKLDNMSKQSLQQKNENTLIVFPNPAVSNITIQIVDGDFLGEEIVIKDMRGTTVKVLKTEPSSNKVEWNCLNTSGTKIPSGFYYATIKTKEKREVVPFQIIK